MQLFGGFYPTWPILASRKSSVPNVVERHANWKQLHQHGHSPELFDWDYRERNLVESDNEWSLLADGLEYPCPIGGSIMLSWAENILVWKKVTQNHINDHLITSCHGIISIIVTELYWSRVANHSLGLYVDWDRTLGSLVYCDLFSAVANAARCSSYSLGFSIVTNG